MEDAATLGARGDLGFLSSVIGLVLVHSTEITTVIQWGVGIVAMAAGIASCWYHIRAARRLK